MLFGDIRKEKIKLAEVLDLKNKFKQKLSHIKRLLKTEEMLR